MNNKLPKVFRLLQQLETEEFEQFDRFVHSPYFITHRDTVKFFDLTKPYYPDFEISFQKIYQELYPGQPYEDVQMRTLRKYLFKLLLKFLSQQEMELAQRETNTALLRNLARRELHTLTKRELERGDELLATYPHQNSIYFQHAIELEEMRYNYRLQTEGRLAPQDLQPFMESLDHYFITEKLSFACTIHYATGLLSWQHPTAGLLKGIIAYVKDHLERLPYIIQAYFHVLNFEQTSDHYHRFKQLIQQQASNFSPEDLVNLCIFAINFCNRQHRKGHKEFLREMFELYQLMLEYNVIFEGSMLSTNNYKNITTLGLRLGEYDWTESFIHTYKDRIEQQYRDGVFHYNLAHLCSYRKEYSKALRYLMQVEFIDPFYRISYNLLLLKIYYECREIEPLLSLCGTFRTYIRRRKVMTDAQKEAYLNFARFTRALFLIKIRRKHSLNKVTHQI
ncbi:MAG: hypothetical protein AAGI38_10645, partial [Bacteroidota bacterium]